MFVLLFDLQHGTSQIYLKCNYVWYESYKTRPRTNAQKYPKSPFSGESWSLHKGQDIEQQWRYT